MTQKKSKMDEKKIIESDLEHAYLSKKRMNQIAPKIKKYETMKKEKNELDSLYGKFTEKEGLEDQHTAISLKIKKQEDDNRKIGKRLVKLNGLDQEFKKQDKELEKYETMKENITKLINVISTKIKDDNIRRSELEEEFSKIMKLGKDGECPTCKRPLKEHFPHVSKHFDQEMSKLSDKISNDSEKKKKQDSELKSIKKKIEEFEEDIVELNKKKIDRTSLQIRLKECKKTIVTLNQDKTSLVRKLKKFSDLKYNRDHHLKINKHLDELSKIKDESMKLSADVKRILVLSDRQKQSLIDISIFEKKEISETKKLDSIGYNEIEYEQSEKNLEQTKEKYSETRVHRIKLKGKLEHLILQIKQIVDNIEEEKEKQITIDKINKEIGSRSKLEGIMNEFKLDLISRIRPILSQRSSELFRKITKGRYSSMDLDEDYNIQIEDEGNQFTTKRFSGGEADLANLCLRIAISQELAERVGGMQVNFIVLDEIFGSQDEGRKHSILEALSKLSNQFKQIIIITHVEDVKEVLPYVLTIKDNSENTVKIEIEGMTSVGTTQNF